MEVNSSSKLWLYHMIQFFDNFLKVFEGKRPEVSCMQPRSPVSLRDRKQEDSGVAFTHKGTLGLAHLFNLKGTRVFFISVQVSRWQLGHVQLAEVDSFLHSLDVKLVELFWRSMNTWLNHRLFTGFFSYFSERSGGFPGSSVERFLALGVIVRV